MRRIILFVGALCCGALPAMAQVSGGLNEVGTRGAIESGKYSNEDNSLTSIDLQTYYGRFISDRLEVGPSFNVYKLEGQAAIGSAAGFADYHFGSTAGPAVPYVEAAAG